MEIVGIVGKRLHGKDTFASYIRSYRERHGATVVTYSFATPLKAFCKELFNLSDYQLNDPAGKESKLPNPVNLDLYVARLKAITQLDIKTRGLVAKSPREILQYVGTEYIRSIDPEYWVKAAAAYINNLSGVDLVLIPDVRYENEANTLRDIGALVVKVIRLDSDQEESTHISENSLDLFVPDYTLGAYTGDFSIYETVAPLMTAELVHIAQDCYDYTEIETGNSVTPFVTEYYKCD